MNIYTPAGPPAADVLHRRQLSRSNSISSSSPAAKDADPSKPPHRRATPPPARRRSSAAATTEGIGSLVEFGSGNINRWSNSTSSPVETREKGHASHPSGGSRPLNTASITNGASLASLNGASENPPSPSKFFSSSSSPSRTAAAYPYSRSPTSSPRRTRPRSPVYNPPSMTAPPQLPVLPLLAATVYDPSSSNGGSPSTGLSTPSTFNNTTAQTDYFSKKPQVSTSAGQRPPSRSKADRVLGRSPLGSPPIGVLESEARYISNPANSRPATASRPSTAGTRDTVQKPAQSAGRERSSSRDQESRNRSESNASSRLDDSHQSTPPRMYFCGLFLYPQYLFD